MEQRLQLFLQMEQLSQSQFADKMGIQRSGVTHLLSGRNKPSFEFISKMLLTFPTLNAEWLILGKGKPYKDSSDAVREMPAMQVVEGPEDIAAEPDSDLFSMKYEDEKEFLSPAETDTFDEVLQSLENEGFQQMGKASSDGRKIQSVIILYEDGTYEKR